MNHLKNNAMQEAEAQCNNQHEFWGGEDPDLNFLERFKRFERITQLSVGVTLFILLAVVFWFNWFNYTWWLVWPLALLTLRSLQRQRISLQPDKPFEARIANLFFLVLIITMVARDLILTILIK